MPTLTVRVIDAGFSGKGENTRITGKFFGHPEIEDGNEAASSPIVTWERDYFPHWGETADGTRYEIANYRDRTWKEVDKNLKVLGAGNAAVREIAGEA